MKVLAAFALWLATARAAVIEATDKDLDSLLSNGVPTILDIYASWCGHCKTFSPVFDDLAAQYEDSPDKVQFIKIDGDKHRKSAKKYNVQYFPTIKWINSDGEHEDINSRSLESLQELIADKTSVKPDGQPATPPPEPKSYVLDLDDSTFEDAIDGKAALVAFTTTWCGHCKNLKPEWEELGRVYARDDDIAIVNVDCTGDDAEALMDTFGIRSFPTIFYFPADDDTPPKMYTGARSIHDFVAHFHRTGDSYRDIDGNLGSQAGVIEPLILEISDAIEAGLNSETVALLKKSIKDTKSKFASKYERIVDKVSEDIGYLQREAGRLTKLAAGKALTPEKKDEITVRLNILRSLAESLEESAKEDIDEVIDEIKEEL